MNQGREYFFQRVSSSLIIPITFLPLAALLLAAGVQLGFGPLEAAGLAVIRTWLPLFYGIGISIGFTDGDGMAALSVAAGFLVMVSVAEAVAGDPALNVGVLGGIVAGAVCTWLYNRVKRVELPEYLALFSGKRMGVQVSALAGVGLGLLLGQFWPPISGGIALLGRWVGEAGAAGALAYGSTLRLMIPIGLHHLLLQVVDTQVGGWLDPAGGKLIAGEYLRFLAGDPHAGLILSGHFVTLGFSAPAAAMAIAHEARPEQRRRVMGLMATGALTAMLLGITEPIEFAFILASPVLFGLHVVLSGLASGLAYFLGIRAGGYALPMLLINWHRTENAWLLVPLGLAFAALYYFSFRAVIRWLRPPILGQTEAPAAGGGEEGPGRAEALIRALGGIGNLQQVTACMTRLRVRAVRPDAVDESALLRLGASGVVRQGGLVQVVLGVRAEEAAERLRAAMAGAAPRTQSGGTTVTLHSPVAGRLVPLEEVPDPAFAGRMVGDGVAVEPLVESPDGRLAAPVAGRVLHVFPGGHAIGFGTPEGLEVLVHVGLDTVSLHGSGFTVLVREGDDVHPGMEIGRFDPAVLTARGRSLITPVLVTNPDRTESITVVAAGSVALGEPLLQVRVRPGSAE